MDHKHKKEEKVDDRLKKRRKYDDDSDGEKKSKLKDKDETQSKHSSSKSSKENGKEDRESKYSDSSDSRNKDRYQYGNRYWGGENNELPYRKNSDRYWNKYSRDEDHVVGSRYYEPHNVSHGRKRDKGRPDRDRARHRSKSKSRSRSPVKVEDEVKNEGTKQAGTQASQPARKALDPITSRTGGAYIPPAKLRMMQASITDKSSAEYQRIAWEALKKSIHGLINKVNTSNIAQIIKQLFKENIVRGRGLLCKSIIQAQALSPTFTHVYAALVALLNSRFPNIGELLLRRLVLQFKRGFKRNDKSICISATTFIAHLVNQRVAHEILALEILTLLVETPTDDSVEVAISFLKECGMKLTEVSKSGVVAIFALLINILHEGKLDKRVQYMIEVIFQIRKDNFKDHEAVIESLDLVEEEDQFTHLITLEDATNGEDILNVFKFDPEYIENEEKYKALSKEMLGESENSDSGSEESGSDDSENEEENDEEKKQVIIDNTETNLVSLRRTIYLTVYSSLDYEECAHKLKKMGLKPGQEVELCNMILDCCCEMRTYEKFFGLLAQRFCTIDKIYIPPFENMFRDSYDTVYRLKPNQLRNVAKFFAHLLFTDAISWEVLSCIKLNEEDTNSSGRIFIKILFQELSEYMGLTKLNERVKDATLDVAFAGLFPRDNPKNTRFAINFFTSIGLGGLTDDLREHLKAQTKAAAIAQVKVESISSSSSSDSDSDSDSSEESSEESESDSEEDRRKHKKHSTKDIKRGKQSKSKKPSLKHKKSKKKKASESKSRKR